MTLKNCISLLLVLVLAALALPAQKSLQISDDAIYDMVKRKLANDPVVKGGALTVEVKNGGVALRGQLETDRQKERAAKLAKKVKGVRSVDNQIAVATRAPR
jgi:hyperosmotically inducible periplasmic protein